MSIIPSFILPLATTTSHSGLFSYFGQSNTAGKFIVIALFLFSLIAWTLMIGKYFELKRLKTLNLIVNKNIDERPSVMPFNPSQKIDYIGPFASLVKQISDIYYEYRTQRLTAQAWQSLVENALQREVAKQSMNYESNMVILGSIVSGAPFLGLLGTVWGVMDAFGGMAYQTSASLSVLAPGVSGALLTTVAGLLVAIPSVFGYNFLLTKTKQMIIELENFASSLSDRIDVEINTQHLD